MQTIVKKITVEGVFYLIKFLLFSWMSTSNIFDR